MINTGLTIRDFSILRATVVLAIMALLASCATTQQEESASRPVAGASPQPENQQEASAASAANAAADSDNAEEEEDPGINREGRIIQLGRFVEDRPEVEVPEDTTVELNYEQEDLRLVFEQLGDQLQINMVIDPSIDNRVSLRSSPDNPLSYDDLWPLLRMLAANAGVTIEQAGNVYRFMRDNSNIPTEIVMPGLLDDATSSEVMQITPLTYLSVETAMTLLSPMLQPEGNIVRLGLANIIGISGTPQQLARVNALLQILDDDPFQNQGIQLYELLNSQAADVATELTNVLTLIEGEQSSYQVMGLERINAVLVIAPANRGFEEVTRWVRLLDAESQGQVEQLFFYKVKSLNATTLAETLTRVFEQNDEVVPAAAVEPEEEEPDLTEPAAGEETLPEPEPPTPETGSPPTPTEIVSANISVTIVADEDTNSLLVRGTPREYQQLLTTINNLDTPPPQVLINAVIGQVTLNDSNEFGVDWRRVSANAASGPARLSSRFLPLADILTPNDGAPLSGSGLVFTRTFQDGAAEIDAVLNAIAQDNEVRLLARPTILATNNQEGEIKVGQAVPIDQGQTVSGNGVVTSNVVYRDVGIVLTITPHINDEGFINLEIFQSLSSVEDNTGVQGNPVFTNQEITTTAVVADQATITLGGLIQEEGGAANSGVPGLRRVPVLGALFSYQRNSTNRRELFVILRPQIINGDERDEAQMQEFRNRFENVKALLEEAGL